MLVAVRVSPVYGELGIVRAAAGYGEVAGLPRSLFLGSSFGLEVTKRFGIFEPGFRAYARPEKELAGSKDFGVSLYASLYCKVRLVDMENWEKGVKRSLILKPVLAIYERGDAKADFYQSGVARLLWDATVFLEVR